jgi:ubiquinone/menaquinone biosynthesis C-methylase UbiE
MNEQYHNVELSIALDPTHPNHILPPPLPKSARVLDVGCGAGQTLIASYPDRLSFGTDVDLDSLRFGKALTKDIGFVNGRAEALPFKNQQFDLVIARVSLPYTNLALSLNEIRRVLRDNGEIWLRLHPFSIAWKQAQSRGYKSQIFFCYIVLNSLCFHIARIQIPFSAEDMNRSRLKGASGARWSGAILAIYSSGARNTLSWRRALSSA